LRDCVCFRGFRREIDNMASLQKRSLR
jgi:hypothetical protein